jgi:hypothetical protein
VQRVTGTAARARGRIVAAALARSWDAAPPATTLSPEALADIAPLLRDAGSAGLVWRRVRGSPLESTPAAESLRDLYRSSVLLHSINEVGIQKVFPFLREEGIEPILIKGWAIARHYPERGLRPSSDLDLVVRPEEFDRASAALDERFDLSRHLVDVHSGCSDLDDRPLDEVYARSRLVDLGGIPVRVLAPEDHLRVLCVHMLRHGVRRPMWACDVAIAVESLPSDFDWNLCLGSNPVKADWVACAIGLAHQLLGARIDGTPVERRAARLPRWLVPAVLRGWGRPLGDTQSVPAYISLLTLLGRPGELLDQMRTRWDRPIQSTVELEGRFTNLPRFPYLLASAARRVPMFSRYAALITRS